VSAELIAAGCLAVASGWRAAVVEADVRRIDRVHDRRAYRPELGWTNARLLTLRRRWAWVGTLAASALVVSLAAPGTAGLLWPLAGATLAIWLARDSRLHHGRYTSVCIATLAAGVALASFSAAAAGLMASVAAAQLYLVAAIRKLRARDFMSGRVLLDTVAYSVCQAAAGNREFLRLISVRRLSDLLERGTLLRACHVAAVATAAAELVVGIGATGLAPVWVTFAIAVPMHLAFTLLSPTRLMPFTAASLGLLALATAHPVFGVWSHT
jgi:hypothetical protein